MYDITLYFSDGTKHTVSNVKEIRYFKRDLIHSVTEDKFMSAAIPITDMCLYSEDSCISISGKNLIMINISKHVG